MVTLWGRVWGGDYGDRQDDRSREQKSLDGFCNVWFKLGSELKSIYCMIMFQNLKYVPYILHNELHKTEKKKQNYCHNLVLQLIGASHTARVKKFSLFR